MGKELIDLDEQALAKASAYFDTATNDGTVNAALRDVAERQRRLEAFDRLRELTAGSEFDYLLDKRNYRR